MNKRQWQVLSSGSAAAVLTLVLGISLHPSPAAGPIVEHNPGHYSESFIDGSVPKWTLLAILGLMSLTGALVYKSRNVAG